MKIKAEFKGMIILAIALALIFAVYAEIKVHRDTMRTFASIDAYVRACQQTGALPTVVQLQERAKKMEDAANPPQFELKPIEPEKKPADKKK